MKNPRLSQPPTATAKAQLPLLGSAKSLSAKKLDLTNAGHDPRFRGCLYLPTKVSTQGYEVRGPVRTRSPALVRPFDALKE